MVLRLVQCENCSNEQFESTWDNDVAECEECRSGLLTCTRCDEPIEECACGSG